MMFAIRNISASKPGLGADLLCIAVAIVVCLLTGKDLNADMLSYHLSTANSLWTGAYKTDFMNAGLQSFFNPLGYLPFYLMLKTGWHSMLVGAVMAALHATALMATWRLSFEILFKEQSQRWLLTALATLMAGASPLFIATLGSSFLDPLLTGLILFGIYLTAHATQPESKNPQMLVFAAGILLGLSTGLKLTAVFFAISVGLALLLSPGIKHRLMRAIISSSGMVLGFAISGSFWAIHLAREFGSPVFPLANAFFKSPDFPAISVGLDRFSAHTPWDALTLPFKMMLVSSGTYAEIMVPDIRLACLLLLAAGLIWRKTRAARRVAVSSEDPGRRWDGSLWFVICAMAIAYLLWVYTSGNGRYFLPVLLIAGPLLVWSANLVIRNHKWNVVIVASLLGLQLVHGGAAGYRRWDSARWTSQWIDLEIPDLFRINAYDFLMIGSGEDTFVSSYLHHDSRYVLIGGKVPRSPREPGAHRIARFIEQGVASGKLRMLIRESETRSSDLYRTNTADEFTILLANADLAPWNLQIVPADCSYIGVDLASGIAQQLSSEPLLRSAWPKHYSMLSCAVETGTKLPPEFFRTLSALESASTELTKSCPQIFPAPSSLPVFLYDSWGIRYPGSDVIVLYKDGKLTYSRFPYGPFTQSLGSLSEWTQGGKTIYCKRLPRR
jgi:hypothetical protein